jgi:hypothetical protein
MIRVEVCLGTQLGGVCVSARIAGCVFSICHLDFVRGDFGGGWVYYIRVFDHQGNGHADHR